MWSKKDCEKFLEVSEGEGSQIRIILNERKAVFHRSHPRKETDKGALVFLRRFLEEEESIKPVEIEFTKIGRAS